MSYQEQRTWSDRFMHEIKGIIGQQLLIEAPDEEDRNHNTDLIVLKFDSIRIACRVRKYYYLLQYPDDITIRAVIPSGGKTELAKIIEGWGNYMFYGFADEQEQRLAAWKIIDLNTFRLWFNRKIVCDKGEVPGKLKQNKDGSSDFRAFDTRQMAGVKILAG